MAVLKSKFRLVTFDVTNTILKFRNSVGDQYSRAGKLFSVESDPIKINAAFRVQWKVMRTEYPNFGKHTGLSSYEWWKKLIHLSFLNADCRMTEEQLTALADYLYKLYATEKCWQVSDGVNKLLRALLQEDIVIGAISNFDERLDSVLLATGLRDYFQFVLASYVVSHEKPNREIFDIALGKVGKTGVTGRDAIHIGDNYELDYLAAKRAGWNALLLRPDNEQITKTNSEDVDTISSFQDIYGFVIKSA